MSEFYFYLCLLAAAILATIAIVLLAHNKIKKKETGKDNLAKLIVGWSLIAITIIGLIIAFLSYIEDSSGGFGLIMVMLLCPLFVIGGFISMLSYGIASLIEGSRKDENGQRNKSLMVKGSFLLGMSLAIVTTIIVTFAVLFATGASFPVAAM